MLIYYQSGSCSLAAHQLAAGSVQTSVHDKLFEQQVKDACERLLGEANDYNGNHDPAAGQFAEADGAHGGSENPPKQEPKKALQKDRSRGKLVVGGECTLAIMKN